MVHGGDDFTAALEAAQRERRQEAADVLASAAREGYAAADTDRAVAAATAQVWDACRTAAARLQEAYVAALPIVVRTERRYGSGFSRDGSGWPITGGLLS